MCLRGLLPPFLKGGERQAREHPRVLLPNTISKIADLGLGSFMSALLSSTASFFW